MELKKSKEEKKKAFCLSINDKQKKEIELYKILRQKKELTTNKFILFLIGESIDQFISINNDMDNIELLNLENFLK